jgi:hypothetical protein
MVSRSASRALPLPPQTSLSGIFLFGIAPIGKQEDRNGVGRRSYQGITPLPDSRSLQPHEPVAFSASHALARVRIVDPRLLDDLEAPVVVRQLRRLLHLHQPLADAALLELRHAVITEWIVPTPA